MRGPVASTEYLRVQSLPRRQWQHAADLSDLCDGLTQLLKTSKGRMQLRESQAAALRDVYDFGGLFGPIAVGEGKTLVTLLAPVVCSAARPLLLVPASVRDQTLSHVLPEMRKHWQLHPGLRVVGYSELSLSHNATLLEDYQPDMIIADECHMLKNRKSGRTRRVSRYMAANPYTTFIALSGTVASYSIMDYWHLLQWALKPDNAPVPRTYYDAQSWALALDERVHHADRTGPGVLGDSTDDARRKYRARLVETPGVVATEETRLGVSLRLLTRPFDCPAEISNVVRQTTDTWDAPDGMPITEAVDLWRVLRTLSAGFYYRWEPAPPADWLEARRAWKAYVRQAIRTSRGRLDTELQVYRQCEREPVSLYEAWRDLRHTHTHDVVPVWFSDALVQDAAHWLAQGPGVVWVESRAFGERLSEVSGARYYGAGDSGILTASGQAIASVQAHSTGKNLQQWDRGLVVTPLTSGKGWEQLLGRFHRQGQQSDSVTFETYQYNEALRAALDQAIADAQFLQDSLGNAQRLLYCDRSAGT